MSEQKVQQLLVLAVKSVKEGDKEKGRQAFLAAIKLDPQNETAWMGLVSVAKDNRERLTALKQVLSRNPNHERALAVLDRLGIPLERLLGETRSDADEPESPLPSQDDEPDFNPFDDSDSAFDSASFTESFPSSDQPKAFVTDSLTPPSSLETDPDPEQEPSPEPTFDPNRSVFDSPPILDTEPGPPIVNPQVLQACDT